MRLALRFLVVILALAACSHARDDADAATHPSDDAFTAVDSTSTTSDAARANDAAASTDAAMPSGRDWTTDPAIAQLPAPTDLYAISDIHGGYDRAVALLARYGLIAAAPAHAVDATWTGGDATLVVIGDLIDKGPNGIEVIDLFRTLEPQAHTAGGAVVVLLGNHEAEFLADPINTKASATDGIDTEIQADGETPQMFSDDTDPRGHWLRTRAFGARVGTWFFAHSGDTHGATLAALETQLEAAVTSTSGWSSNDIIGTTSILESRSWYTADPTLGTTYANAIGAHHIVFGHDPNALGARGAIAIDGTGALFRIDTGMSPDVNYSSGSLFHVHSAGGTDTAEALVSDGTTTALWSGAH
jgi:hypothetical protein